MLIEKAEGLVEALQASELKLAIFVREDKIVAIASSDSNFLRLANKFNLGVTREGLLYIDDVGRMGLADNRRIRVFGSSTIAVVTDYNHQRTLEVLREIAPGLIFSFGV